MRQYNNVRQLTHHGSRVCMYIFVTRTDTLIISIFDIKSGTSNRNEKFVVVEDHRDYVKSKIVVNKKKNNYMTLK